MQRYYTHHHQSEPIPNANADADAHPNAHSPSADPSDRGDEFDQTHHFPG